MTIPLPDKIAVPKELGTIEMRRPGNGNGNGNGLHIVFIRDAHAVEDAQSNIETLIRHLQEHYRIDVVALEGGAGEVDPTLFRSFPREDVKKRVLSGYRARGELSGAEMAAIFNPQEAFYFGIEDWALYEENYWAFITASRNRAVILRELEDRERSLDERRGALYSPEMNELHEKQKAFREGRAHLLEFLAYLKQQAKKPEADKFPELAVLFASIDEETAFDTNKMELSLRALADDFQEKHGKKLSKESLMDWNSAYQDFLTARSDARFFLDFLVKFSREEENPVSLTAEMKAFLEHAERLSALKGTRLFEELESLTRDLEEYLIQNDEQRKLRDQYQRINLLRDMAKLELAREELKTYQKDPQSYEALLEDTALMAPALQFYRFALDRDRALHANLVKLLHKRKAKSAIVVLGGFHTEGFEENLAREGYSYTVITPKISSLQGHEHYEQVMGGKISYKANLQGSFYDAFVRHATLKLVGELNEPDFRAVLKTWRDNVIRGLAERGRLAEAREYTRYVDILLDLYIEKFGVANLTTKSREDILKDIEEELKKFQERSLDRLWERVQFQVEKFADGLAGLIREKRVTAESVQGLLNEVAKAKPSGLAIWLALGKGRFSREDVNHFLRTGEILNTDLARVIPLGRAQDVRAVLERLVGPEVTPDTVAAAQRFAEARPEVVRAVNRAIERGGEILQGTEVRPVVTPNQAAAAMKAVAPDVNPKATALAVLAGEAAQAPAQVLPAPASKAASMGDSARAELLASPVHNDLTFAYASLLNYLNDFKGLKRERQIGEGGKWVQILVRNPAINKDSKSGTTAGLLFLLQIPEEGRRDKLSISIHEVVVSDTSQKRGEVYFGSRMQKIDASTRWELQAIAKRIGDYSLSQDGSVDSYLRRWQPDVKARRAEERTAPAQGASLGNAGVQTGKLAVQDFSAFKGKSLYWVHATDYFPEGGVIKSGIHATRGRYLRNTVHGALNHVVLPVMGSAGWGEKKYVIVVPLQDLANENPGQIQGGTTVDFFFDDNVKLPESAKIFTETAQMLAETQAENYMESKGTRIETGGDWGWLELGQREWQEWAWERGIYGGAHDNHWTADIEKEYGPLPYFYFALADMVQRRGGLPSDQDEQREFWNSIYEKFHARRPYDAQMEQELLGDTILSTLGTFQSFPSLKDFIKRYTEVSLSIDEYKEGRYFSDESLKQALHRQVDLQLQYADGLTAEAVLQSLPRGVSGPRITRSGIEKFGTLIQQGNPIPPNSAEALVETAMLRRGVSLSDKAGVSRVTELLLERFDMIESEMRDRAAKTIHELPAEITREHLERVRTQAIATDKPIAFPEFSLEDRILRALRRYGGVLLGDRGQLEALFDEIETQFDSVRAGINQTGASAAPAAGAEVGGASLGADETEALSPDDLSIAVEIARTYEGRALLGLAGSAKFGSDIDLRRTVSLPPDLIEFFGKRGIGSKAFLRISRILREAEAIRQGKPVDLTKEGQGITMDVTQQQPVWVEAGPDRYRLSLEWRPKIRRYVAMIQRQPLELGARLGTPHEVPLGEIVSVGTAEGNSYRLQDRPGLAARHFSVRIDLKGKRFELRVENLTAGIPTRVTVIKPSAGAPLPPSPGPFAAPEGGQAPGAADGASLGVRRSEVSKELADLKEVLDSFAEYIASSPALTEVSQDQRETADRERAALAVTRSWLDKIAWSIGGGTLKELASGLSGMEQSVYRLLIDSSTFRDQVRSIQGYDGVDDALLESYDEMSKAYIELMALRTSIERELESSPQTLAPPSPPDYVIGEFDPLLSTAAVRFVQPLADPGDGLEMVLMTAEDQIYRSSVNRSHVFQVGADPRLYVKLGERFYSFDPRLGEWRALLVDFTLGNVFIDPLSPSFQVAFSIESNGNIKLMNTTENPLLVSAQNVELPTDVRLEDPPGATELLSGPRGTVRILEDWGMDALGHRVVLNGYQFLITESGINWKGSEYGVGQSGLWAKSDTVPGEEVRELNQEILPSLQARPDTVQYLRAILDYCLFPQWEQLSEELNRVPEPVRVIETELDKLTLVVFHAQEFARLLASPAQPEIRGASLGQALIPPSAELAGRGQVPAVVLPGFDLSQNREAVAADRNRFREEQTKFAQALDAREAIWRAKAEKLDGKAKERALLAVERDFELAWLVLARITFEVDSRFGELLAALGEERPDVERLAALTSELAERVSLVAAEGLDRFVVEARARAPELARKGAARAPTVRGPSELAKPRVTPSPITFGRLPSHDIFSKDFLLSLVLIVAVLGSVFGIGGLVSHVASSRAPVSQVAVKEDRARDRAAQARKRQAEEFRQAYERVASKYRIKWMPGDEFEKFYKAGGGKSVDFGARTFGFYSHRTGEIYMNGGEYPQVQFKDGAPDFSGVAPSEFRELMGHVFHEAYHALARKYWDGQMQGEVQAALDVLGALARENPGLAQRFLEDFTSVQKEDWLRLRSGDYTIESYPSELMARLLQALVEEAKAPAREMLAQPVQDEAPKEDRNELAAGGFRGLPGLERLTRELADYFRKYPESKARRTFEQTMREIGLDPTYLYHYAPQPGQPGTSWDGPTAAPPPETTSSPGLSAAPVRGTAPGTARTSGQSPPGQSVPIDRIGTAAGASLGTLNRFNRPRDQYLPDELSAKTTGELLQQFTDSPARYSGALPGERSQRDAFVYSALIKLHIQGNVGRLTALQDGFGPEADISDMTGEGLLRALHDIRQISLVGSQLTIGITVESGDAFLGTWPLTSGEKAHKAQELLDQINGIEVRLSSSVPEINGARGLLEGMRYMATRFEFNNFWKGRIQTALDQKMELIRGTRNVADRLQPAEWMSALQKVSSLKGDSEDDQAKAAHLGGVLRQLEENGAIVYRSVPPDELKRGDIVKIGPHSERYIVDDPTNPAGITAYEVPGTVMGRGNYSRRLDRTRIAFSLAVLNQPSTESSQDAPPAATTPGTVPPSGASLGARIEPGRVVDEFSFMLLHKFSYSARVNELRDGSFVTEFYDPNRKFMGRILGRPDRTMLESALGIRHPQAGTVDTSFSTDRARLHFRAQIKDGSFIEVLDYAALLGDMNVRLELRGETAKIRFTPAGFEIAWAVDLTEVIPGPRITEVVEAAIEGKNIRLRVRDKSNGLRDITFQHHPELPTVTEYEEKLRRVAFLKKNIQVAIAPVEQMPASVPPTNQAASASGADGLLRDISNVTIDPFDTNFPTSKRTLEALEARVQTFEGTAFWQKVNSAYQAQLRVLEVALKARSLIQDIDAVRATDDQAPGRMTTIGENIGQLWSRLGAFYQPVLSHFQEKEKEVNREDKEREAQELLARIRAIHIDTIQVRLSSGGRELDGVETQLKRMRGEAEASQFTEEQMTQIRAEYDTSIALINAVRTTSRQFESEPLANALYRLSTNQPNVQANINAVNKQREILNQLEKGGKVTYVRLVPNELRKGDVVTIVDPTQKPTIIVTTPARYIVVDLDAKDFVTAFEIPLDPSPVGQNPKGLPKAGATFWVAVVAQPRTESPAAAPPATGTGASLGIGERFQTFLQMSEKARELHNSLPKAFQDARKGSLQAGQMALQNPHSLQLGDRGDEAHRYYLFDVAVQGTPVGSILVMEDRAGQVEDIAVENPAYANEGVRFFAQLDRVDPLGNFLQEMIRSQPRAGIPTDQKRYVYLPWIRKESEADQVREIVEGDAILSHLFEAPVVPLEKISAVRVFALSPQYLGLGFQDERVVGGIFRLPSVEPTDVMTLEHEVGHGALDEILSDESKMENLVGSHIRIGHYKFYRSIGDPRAGGLYSDVRSNKVFFQEVLLHLFTGFLDRSGIALSGSVSDYVTSKDVEKFIELGLLPQWAAPNALGFGKKFIDGEYYEKLEAAARDRNLAVYEVNPDLWKRIGAVVGALRGVVDKADARLRQTGTAEEVRRREVHWIPGDDVNKLAIAQIAVWYLVFQIFYPLFSLTGAENEMRKRLGLRVLKELSLSFGEFRDRTRTTSMDEYLEMNSTVPVNLGLALPEEDRRFIQNEISKAISDLSKDLLALGEPTAPRLQIAIGKSLGKQAVKVDENALGILLDRSPEELLREVEGRKLNTRQDIILFVTGLVQKKFERLREEKLREAGQAAKHIGELHKERDKLLQAAYAGALAGEIRPLVQEWRRLGVDFGRDTGRETRSIVKAIKLAVIGEAGLMAHMRRAEETRGVTLSRDEIRAYNRALSRVLAQFVREHPRQRVYFGVNPRSEDGEVMQTVLGELRDLMDALVFFFPKGQSGNLSRYRQLGKPLLLKPLDRNPGKTVAQAADHASGRLGLVATADTIAPQDLTQVGVIPFFANADEIPEELLEPMLLTAGLLISALALLDDPEREKVLSSKQRFEAYFKDIPGFFEFAKGFTAQNGLMGVRVDALVMAIKARAAVEMAA